MTKFFPPPKIAHMVQEINTFKQMEKENLAEAWERFHELSRRCLHHRLTRWMQVHTFYNGLSDSTKTIMDAYILLDRPIHLEREYLVGPINSLT